MAVADFPKSTALLVWLFVSSAWAGQVFQPRFVRLGVADGLSQAVVQCVLQDARGYLWVGTQDGLNRYDGYGFRVFKHDPTDPDGLSDNVVFCAAETDDGSLWFGTRNGLNRYDPARERFTCYGPGFRDAGLPEAWIWSVTVARDGMLWLGTWGGGLAAFDPVTETARVFRHDPDAPSLPHDHVTSVAEDAGGGLWVGTLGGLGYRDPATGGVTAYTGAAAEAGLADAAYYTTLAARDGTVWLGTKTRGLLHLDPRTGAVRAYRHRPDDPHALSDDLVIRLFEDAAGTLWAGTWNGLSRLRPDREGFDVVRRREGRPWSLSHSEVWALHEDAGGLLWVGTRDGLNVYNPRQAVFRRFAADLSEPYTLADNEVWSVGVDGDDTLWVGTRTGLTRIHEAAGTVRSYSHQAEVPGSLPEGTVLKLGWDAADRLWVMTHNALSRFDAATDRFLSVPVPADGTGEAPSLLSLAADTDGDFWVGTSADPFRFDPRTGTFRPAFSAAGDREKVQAVLVSLAAADGRRWFGTQSNGLVGYDPRTSTLTAYRARPGVQGLPADDLLCLSEFPDGVLWIGTMGAGLCRMDTRTERFTYYGEKDGLPNGVVYGILPDRQGFLWVSTNKGLARFDPREETWKAFRARDGLQGDEFNEGAAFAARDGALYFGGVDGLTAFYPHTVARRGTPPPVVFTDFKRFNDSVPPSSAAHPTPLPVTIDQVDSLELSYRDEVFSLAFSALDFTYPAQNRYAYKLEGFDRDWVVTGADRRFAGYTSLSPGSYRFLLKAAGSEGVWSETPRVLPIHIAPPPWASWWAYLLYAAAAVCAVWWYLRAQRRKLAEQRRINRRLREVDRLKDQFLANTSHELRTPLNGIIGLADSLARGALEQLPRPEVVAQLNTIVAGGRRLAGLVDDLLDFGAARDTGTRLHREALHLPAVIDHVLLLTRPLCAEKPISLHNAVPPDFPAVFADEGRLKQIFHNLLGNAVKFTEAGSVTVTAAHADQQARIAVTDTGPGIAADHHARIFEPFEQGDASLTRRHGGTGLGLSTVRRLVDLHGGTCAVDSTPGEGAVFSFTLPLAEGDRRPAPRPEAAAAPTDPAPRAVASTAAHEAGIQPFRDETILVVDDDPVNVQVLENQLRLHGYRVVGRPDGPSALTFLRETDTEIGLVLLDVMMPELSGYDVCRDLRKDYALFELPVLMVTAKTRPEDVVAGLEAGANDYLLKPFDQDELAARVKTLLAVRRLTRSNRVLVEANELKSRFVGMAAHDLKNPLMGIIMEAGILEKSVGNDPAAAELVADIRQTSQWMMAFVTNLLDVTALEQGRFSLRREAVDLHACADKALAVYRRQAARKHQTLVLLPDPGVAPARGDRRRLAQVLDNLIGNAVKYAPEHSTITVSVHETPHGPAASVRDEGPGIAEEELPLLFQKFRRLSSTPTGGEPATGLGLSIVKQLVDLMDGRVEVTSTLGEGSCFTVVFPRDTTAADQPPA